MPKTTKPFDFASLDLKAITDKPTEIELHSPDANNPAPLGVFISLIGSESDSFQRYLRDKGNEARLRIFREQRTKGGPTPVKVEEEETTIVAGISALVSGWRTVTDGVSEPVIIWGERRLEFNQANLLEWLGQFRWVCGQINDAAADLSTFIKA